MRGAGPQDSVRSGAASNSGRESESHRCIEGPPALRTGRPAAASWLGGEWLAGGVGGQFGPKKAGEFARDGDGGDSGALVAPVEVVVAVVQADLRLPGAVCGR